MCRFIKAVLAWLYYTPRNLLYYYKERSIRPRPINDRTEMTDMFLECVGLRVVLDESDTVPRYIPLSAVQKSWIDIVSKHGYKVGLR